MVFGRKKSVCAAERAQEAEWRTKWRICMKKKWMSIFAVLCIICILAGCGEAPAVTNRSLYRMDVSKYVTLGEYDNINVSVEPAKVEQSQWDELLLAV